MGKLQALLGDLSTGVDMFVDAMACCVGRLFAIAQRPPTEEDLENDGWATVNETKESTPQPHSRPNS